MNYYNEYDKHAAAWLRELIAQGLIPAGDVDERSICDVSAVDLRGYTQCHFFAGIGGWSYALQLAGWPASRPVWSASCPCQPFSTAGKGLAQQDERHLWPVFFNLLKECRPQYCFGEQVASAIGHGWLDGISADLEAEGYACGSAVLGAHSVGAPHIRQRLYWVAYSSSERHDGQHALLQREESRREQQNCTEVARCCEAGGLADNGSGRREVESFNARSSGEASSEREASVAGVCSASSGMGDSGCSSDERRGDSGDVGRQTSKEQGEAWQRERGWYADCDSVQDDHRLADANGFGSLDGEHATDGRGTEAVTKRGGGSWSDFTLVHCRDGKVRRIPTEPAFQPLAHGIPARVVRLRGYGNAIVPEAAAQFIQATEEALSQ